jgi:uncharacterized protein YwgA
MQRIEKIIAIFKELKFTPAIDEFQDRLIAQKVNCLLNLSGVKTGYECNLYIRGPYSPDLADALFTNKEHVEKLQTDVSLTNDEKQKVRELKSIFDTNASHLEIGSTYAYLTLKDRMPPLDAMRKVKAMKSFFTESQIAVGVSKAKEFLSKPPKELVDEVIAESEMWKNAQSHNT